MNIDAWIEMVLCICKTVLSTSTYYLLKSVFSEIQSQRTWLQVVFALKNRPPNWLTYLVYQLKACFFGGETTWTHVLTRILEKTDSSKYAYKNTYYMYYQSVLYMDCGCIVIFMNTY